MDDACEWQSLYGNLNLFTTHISQHIEWRCRDLSEFLAETTDTPLHERSALLGKVIPETKFRLDVGTQPHSLNISLERF